MLHAILAALLLAAPVQKADDPPKGKAPAIPETVFVAESPADAKCVAEAKKAAKKGDTVVIKAKIGGRAEPFVRNRAVVMLADRCLRSCDEIPDDPCTKPWDYCCEPPESKKANMMTMQVVGTDGKPLKTGLQGVRDLEPLALIVIEGTVAEIDANGTFVVNAAKIHVEKKAPAGKSGAKDAAKDAAKPAAK